MKLNWVDFYMGLAFAAARKSPDEQTKCGCVLVDVENRFLSLGFNGFPRGFPDEELPRTRPEKYPWMSHAEANAIDNTDKDITGATAYVNVFPCNPCIYRLYQKGIRNVICGPKSAHKSWYKPEDEKWLNEFLDKSKRSRCGELVILEVQPKVEWLRDAADAALI